MTIIIGIIIFFAFVFIIIKAFKKETSESKVIREDENGNKVTETIITEHHTAGKAAARGTLGCFAIIIGAIILLFLFITL